MNPKRRAFPLMRCGVRGKAAPPRKSVENRKPKNRVTLLRCKTQPAMLAPRPSGAQRSYAARGRPVLALLYIRTEPRLHGTSSVSSISLDDTGLKHDPITETERSVYCLRHTAIYMRIILSQGKVNIFNLAKNAGTSVNQIERFYARNLPLSPELAKNLQSFGE